MIRIHSSASERRFLLLGVLIALIALLSTATAMGDDRATTSPTRAMSVVPDSRVTAAREIFVASNGWHSAIFIARATIPRGAIPVVEDFPRAVYLGFGWGDAAYFPDPEPGVLTLISAALQPTPSVIHVTGLSSHPRDAFPKDEVIVLKLSADGFQKLLGFLNAAFSREGAGRVIVQAPGLHSFSKFYRAEGQFHMFNNCNSWTARGLEAGGLPIKADTIFRAEGLMAELRVIAK